MKELKVGQNEAGQRLIRLLGKYLREAPDAFLYRMLRKKNIVLNERKATGKESLTEGDVVRIYMADETIEKFRGNGAGEDTPDLSDISDAAIDAFRDTICYEDDQLLIADKPAGMLSQRADAKDLSLIDRAIAYLIRQGELDERSLDTFKPGLVSRLDRNTSGLVMIGKTLPALQALNEAVREHTIRKYYEAVVSGALEAAERLEGWWTKDERENLVTITQEAREGASRVVTEVEPLEVFRRGDRTYTLVRVGLETGKGHQIRAHLASAGHPLVGDKKYGGENTSVRRGQLLHASELVFPEAEALPEVLRAVAGRKITVPRPDDMSAFMDQVSKKA